MLNYIILSILSYSLGVISVISFSVMKVNSRCIRKEGKGEFG